MGLPGGLGVKNSSADEGVTGLILGPRRFHMMQSNYLCTTATEYTSFQLAEDRGPRTRALAEKAPQ